jgi:hypothetical protein
MSKDWFLAIGLAWISVPAASAPGDMKISTFLQKADALKAKGMLALASSDVGLLKTEGQAAGNAYRARIKSDKANNRAPHSCPPAKASLKSDELLAHFRSYTVPQRQQMSVRTGFADMMQRRYPCKS